MPGRDYDSAINVHICRNGVPGMSAAHDNQALNLAPEMYITKGTKCARDSVAMTAVMTLVLF